MAARGLGLLSSMFLLGRIAKRGFDTRRWWRRLCHDRRGELAVGSLNLTMSRWDFMTPTIFKASGMGLHLTQTCRVGGESVDPREQMGYGARHLCDVAKYRWIDWELSADPLG